MASCRIIDIEHSLVWREGQPIGTVEIIHQQCKLSIRCETIYAIEGQLLSGSEVFQSVGRVCKIDAAVRPDHHIVGAVEPSPFVSLGKH